MKPVILTTDFLFFLLLFVLVAFGFMIAKREDLKKTWVLLFKRPIAMCALILLVLYVLVALLDSIHFRKPLTPSAHQDTTHYSVKLTSLLDVALHNIGAKKEKTYSAPLALNSYQKEAVRDGEKVEYRKPALNHAGKHLRSSAHHQRDIIIRFFLGALMGVGISMVVFIVCMVASLNRKTLKERIMSVWKRETRVAELSIWSTLFIVITLGTACFYVAQFYHLMGTDSIGEDVLYQSIKSIRTGLMIGTLTTLIMLPFALSLGAFAGYFGGVVDDVIQYIYTTLSAIPGVLLIAASILMMQVLIAKHPEAFPTVDKRSDIRLLALCFILGVTSWTSLCRLIRAEVLKLKQMDFMLASRALGVHPLLAIARHILPNVMHIVLITVAMDFSMLILAEAVLSYVGVGVDPTTYSWGNMINRARLELAREPSVWWSLTAAFGFMFVLVLSANIFAENLREVFDPRMRQ